MSFRQTAGSLGWSSVLASCWLLATLIPCSGWAGEEADTAGISFFEAKIRPILIERCYECHSESAAEGGLRVDSRAALRKGGERGPAVVPGRPQASLLLTAVSHTDVDLKMPPKGAKLSDSVIADLTRWIKLGAPDPRTGDATPDDPRPVLDAARHHWAYQPLVAASAPATRNTNWPRSELDSFILAALEKNNLRPSPDAPPRALLRRLHFDLVGLPPSLTAMQQFQVRLEQHGIEAALATEVDKLLASKQFGERWGRHWLDVARFGESSGGESNVSFPYAWRYRDYVIDALNADVPYDRFLTEQIAGDLLPCDDKAEWARRLTATGFLAVGPKNLGENNDRKFQADIVDEQIDALTRAVLASSVACARCHHHKFDPFLMEDYYALGGVFASTKTYFGTFTSPANNQSGDPLVLPRVEGQTILHASLPPARFEKMKAQLAVLEAEYEEIEASRRTLFSGRKPKKVFTLREVLANIWRRGPLEGKLETVDDQGRALPLAMGVRDADRILDAPLLARGEIGRPGATVPRAFPRSLSIAGLPPMPAHQSGRLELARWLTHPEHPLTSRVLVNRVWQHLFGRGLVATVDNFGTTGAEPSHPELLDALAIRFMQDGWSLKQLVRSLVLSRTYRQASTFNDDAFRQDPENELLWRMPKRRLEAEAIRDAMLSASAELDRSRPDGSLVATVIGDRPISLIGLDKKLPKDLDGATYRSVYLPVIRDRLPDVLELFDFAEPSLVTGARETTNVPVQALYLMNSQFVQQRAQAMARRILSGADDDAQRVELAFQICFGRDPDSEEKHRALAFLRPEGKASEVAEGEAERNMMSFCQALLSTAEFRNLD